MSETESKKSALRNLISSMYKIEYNEYKKGSGEKPEPPKVKAKSQKEKKVDKSLKKDVSGDDLKKIVQGFFQKKKEPKESKQKPRIIPKTAPVTEAKVKRKPRKKR